MRPSSPRSGRRSGATGGESWRSAAGGWSADPGDDRGARDRPHLRADVYAVHPKGANDPISWLVGVLQGLVAGAYFPPSELSSALYAIARCLPQTYTIDAIRRLLLHDEPAPTARIGTLSPLASDVVIVAVMTIFTLALGTVAFRLGIRKAQRDGDLSRWS